MPGSNHMRCVLRGEMHASKQDAKARIPREDTSFGRAAGALLARHYRNDALKRDQQRVWQMSAVGELAGSRGEGRQTDGEKPQASYI